MRRALIVDDSKTAQVRLQLLLKPYDLVIDTANSAEEALGYLSYKSPAVIFLDHHMEGMNGFEALKILKANPNTAMIPVVMYTSEKGDVYVGQARALGALDILSKDIIHSSSLEKVLSGLRLYPNKGDSSPKPDSSTTKTDKAPASKPSSDAPAKVDKVEPIGSNASSTSNIAPATAATKKTTAIPREDLNQVRSQIAKLFEIHIADVRSQITENTKFILRRLTNDIKRLEARVTAAQEKVSQTEEDDTEENANNSPFNRISMLAAGLLVVVGFLAFQTYSNHSALSQLSASNEALQQMNRKLIEVSERSELVLSQLVNNSGSALSPINTTSSKAVDGEHLYTAISWAMNADMQFPYDASPLDEQRIDNLYSLADKLQAAGFKGTVYLDLNFGEFCLDSRSASGWQLASYDTPVTDCTMMSEVYLDFPTENYISRAYLSFEQSFDAVHNNSIRFEVNSLGTSSPIHSYPPDSPSTSAAEWNNIAAKNNHISIRLDQAL